MPVPPESGIWNAAVGTAPATVAKAATASILLLVRPLGAGASAYASRNIMCLSIDLVLRPRCSCTCSCGSRGVALQVGSPCVRPAWDMGSFSFRVKNEEIVGDVLRQLVAAGADCSIKDSQGRTVYDRLRKRRKLFEIVKAAENVSKMRAFTMGFHDRLGANSSLSFLKELDPDVLRDHVFSKL